MNRLRIVRYAAHLLCLSLYVCNGLLLAARVMRFELQVWWAAVQQIESGWKKK